MQRHKIVRTIQQSQFSVLDIHYDLDSPLLFVFNNKENAQDILLIYVLLSILLKSGEINKICKKFLTLTFLRQSSFFHLFFFFFLNMFLIFSPNFIYCTQCTRLWKNKLCRYYLSLYFSRTLNFIFFSSFCHMYFQ